MAKKVDEAKVKFTAETSEFQQNVKKASNEIGLLSSELRLNSAEMKNAGETTALLKERQSLLKQELNASREKTKNLNLQLESAKKIFGEDSEAVAKLNKQLNTSKTSEQKIQTELDQTNEKLKTNAQNYGLSTEKAEKFNKITTTISKSSVAVTTAVAGMAVAAVKEASTFEDAMAKVTTIAKDVDVEINGKTTSMKDAILELSNETGKDASTIAESVYSAISAGQDTADAVNFVSKSLKLAKSGFTEGEKATDILTTALNAYNLEADKTTEISDLLITTQNLGKTTVDELASSMGNVIPVAKSNGVEMSQLCAAYAELTAKGIATNQTTTLLKSLFQELGKSGSASADILQEKTGKTFKELMASGESLSDIIKIIDDEAKANDKSLSDYFSKINASTAATSLLGDSTSEFNDILQEMNESTGATDTAFEKLDTASTKANKALNKIKLSAIEVGTNILNELEPSMDNFFNKVDEGTKWIINNSDEIVTAMKVIGVTSASVFVVNKIAQFGKSVGTIKTAVSGAVSSIKALTVARVAETVATEAETVATEGLTIAQMATPWGVVAGLVAGVTVGLAAYAIATQNATDDLWEEDEATKELIDSTEKLTDKHKELQEELENNKSTRSENITSIEEENAQVDVLWRKLKELNEVQDKTNAQKETMKSLVDDLNEIMPDLNLQYDEEKDKLNKSTKAIEKNIKAQKNLSLVKAAQENVEAIAGDIAKTEIENSELTKQQIKNEDALTEAKKKTAAAEEEMAKARARLDEDSYSEASRVYREAYANQEKLQKAYDDTQKSINENEKTLEDLNEEYDKTTQYAENLINENEITEKLNKITKKCKKAGIEIPKAISEGIKSGEYAVPSSVDEMQSLITFNDLKNKAQDTGINIPKLITNGIKSGELSPAEAVDQMNRWIDFSEAVNKAELGGVDIPKKLKKGILNGKTSIKEAIKELTTTAKTELDNNADKYTKAGKTAGENFQKAFAAAVDPSAIWKKITTEINNKTVTGNISTGSSVIADSPGVHHNAVGNIIEKPILTTFAENGPEAAIPINSSIRSRMLWIETGRRMGILNDVRTVPDYSSMAEVNIQNKVDMAETNNLLRTIAMKNSDIYVGATKITEATATARDTTDGLRQTLVRRGLAIE